MINRKLLRKIAIRVIKTMYLQIEGWKPKVNQIKDDIKFIEKDILEILKSEKCGKFVEGKSERLFGYWNEESKCWRKINLCGDCQDEIKCSLWRVLGNEEPTKKQ